MKVYLDNAATTKLDPRVLEVMTPYMLEKYGNASSIHYMGEENAGVFEKAKEGIANVLNCSSDGIVFTGGASEANNMIIKGVMRGHKDKGKHILVSAIEHSSVLEPARQLEKEGFEVEYIPVDSKGLVDPEVVEKMLRDDTVLVSVMAVNNEVGTIQDVEAISKIAHEKGAYFHTDAVQAIPYLEIDIDKWGMDFLSLSAHKFYGPRGMGIAYVNPKIKICPLIDGGEQAGGLRAGTYNVPGIVGMAEALKLSYEERDEYLKKVGELSDHMWKRINSEIEDVVLNGDKEHRVFVNLNVRFERVEGEAILMELSAAKGVCVSTGSACSSQVLKVSHVLKAMGIDEDYMNSNIRFTLGRFNTMEEVDYTVDCLKQIVERLRSFSSIEKKS